MATNKSTFGELVEQLEQSLEIGPGPIPLETLVQAAETLRNLRRRYRDDAVAASAFVDRLRAISARVAAGLNSATQQLVTVMFANEVELRPLLERKERYRSALNEICLAQPETKVRFYAPEFDGHVTASERRGVSLPKINSSERETLDALVRSKPEYWMDASILQAARLKLVCDRVADIDPDFDMSARHLLHPSREYTIRLHSPQLKELTTEDSEELQ